MSSQSKRTDQQELYGTNSELQARMNDLQQSLLVNKSMLKQLADQKLLKTLKQNEDMHAKLQIIMSERNSAQIKSLLSEQISEEAHRREFESEMDFQEKIQEIEYKDQRHDFLIKQLRQKLDDTQEYAEFIKQLHSQKITLPTPKILKRHNKIMKYQDRIQKATKQIKNINEQANQISQKSDIIQSKSDKYMALLYSPIHWNKTQQNKKNQRNKFKNKMNTQKNMDRSFSEYYNWNSIISEEDSNSSSFEDIQFDEKVSLPKKQKPLPTSVIPSLNMNRVRLNKVAQLQNERKNQSFSQSIGNSYDQNNFSTQVEPEFEKTQIELKLELKLDR